MTSQSITSHQDLPTITKLLLKKLCKESSVCKPSSPESTSKKDHPFTKLIQLVISLGTRELLRESRNKTLSTTWKRNRKREAGILNRMMLSSSPSLLCKLSSAKSSRATILKSVLFQQRIPNLANFPRKESNFTSTKSPKRTETLWLYGSLLFVAMNLCEVLNLFIFLNWYIWTVILQFTVFS